MRIAIGGWLHETDTFSTVPTRYEDFAIAEGDARVPWGPGEGPATAGCTFVPLVNAMAAPAGPVTPDAYRRIAGAFFDGIRAALPLDAVFLGLHGAMEVEGMEDAQADFARAVRDVTGPDVLLCGTLDSHANLSQAFVGAFDFLTSLRTAPHRDCSETHERGLRLMMRCLHEGLRPVSELARIPLILTGEAAVTETEPARGLHARLPEIDARPGILTSSILTGCAWADTPHTGVSVLVSGTDPEAVQREARALAEEIWACRAEFAFDMPAAPVDEAIRAALAAPERPVFLADSGDNPTAGGGGDSPHILERLIALGAKDAVVAGIRDAEARDACFRAGEGAEVDLVLGGKRDATFARPLPVRARVLRLVEDTGTGHPRALIETGGVEVVLQADAQPFVMIFYFEKMGIDLSRKKIAVVKQGYLWPDIRDNAPRGLMALSPGFTDLRLERLPFRRLTRPIWPLDAETRWP